ncbi:MAG: AAA family ATPase [Candidatus Saccharibacteria bacterium]|nr:AAA family ATPase [Candidatus Saccharibacteria bacterium]
MNEGNLFKIEKYSDTIYKCFYDFVDTVFFKNKCFLYDEDKSVSCSFSDLVDAWKKAKDNKNLKTIIKDETSLIADGNGKWLKKINDLSDKDQKNKVKLLFAHIHYLWSLGGDIDTSAGVFFNSTKNQSNLFPTKDQGCLWGMGSLTIYKPKDFHFLLNLLEHLEDIRRETCEETIKILCQKLEQSEEYTKNNGIPLLHGLLHFCDPSKYAAIESIGHKKSLSDFYKGGKDKKNEPYDTNVKKAGEKIKNIFFKKENDTKSKSILNECDSIFYNDLIRPLWMEDETDISDLNLLLSKKAVILYGPPGTGKSYTAQILAQSLLAKHYFKDGLSQIPEDFNFVTKSSDRILKLQLHANYSYDDFICGQKLDNDEIKTVKGKLLEIIDKLKSDKEYKDAPYILILDEINRTDLSKLFGELFSAIENRDDEIVIPKLGNIKIPSNLYFIGTMNEIDYSLEQIDFALRRRFSWIFKGYNESTLRSMLFANGINVANDPKALDFVKKCSVLNKTISDNPLLGPKYEIGHAIFAEIAKFNENKTEWDNSIKELWLISIKPLLESYLGTLSSEEKESTLKTLKEKFFTQEDSNTNNICDDKTILEKKKAIILYGPPGTGKTHAAKQLVDQLGIAQEHKLRLQLHANYTYDNFICGDVLEGDKEKKIVRRAGELLEFIKNIGSNKAVLILDEINRADVSKLFGELFSAIENRGEKVSLPQKVFYQNDKECFNGIDSICIPENLYIIGTMNEIDFSLEQIDFALRRRFAWIFKGYSDDGLNSIIEKRLDQFKKNWEDDYKNEYSNNCRKLNEEIEKKLGQEFQIGHVIFADIAIAFINICNKNFISDKNFTDAQNITWNTSIKPLLEAYLGGKVENEKDLEKQLKNFKLNFIPLFTIDSLKKKLKKKYSSYDDYAKACETFFNTYKTKETYLLTSDYIPNNQESDRKDLLRSDLSKKLKKQMGTSFKENEFNEHIAPLLSSLEKLKSIQSKD